MQHTAHRHIPHQSAASSRMSDPDAFAHPERNIDVLGIQAGERVADFGSGSGAYAISIAQRVGRHGHVFAIDVQRDLLKRTKNDADRQGLHNLSVIWGDLETRAGSKISPRSLDHVVVSNLLFQVDDKAAVLREAHRVLLPQGSLAIIDWEDASRPDGTRIGPRRDQVFHEKDALALASELGFALDHVFRAGAHHYGLILRPVSSV